MDFSRIAVAGVDAAAVARLTAARRPELVDADVGERKQRYRCSAERSPSPRPRRGSVRRVLGERSPQLRCHRRVGLVPQSRSRASPPRRSCRRPAEFDPVRLAEEILERGTEGRCIDAHRHDRASLRGGSLEFLAHVRRSDRVFGKDDDQDRGLVDRPYDRIGIERSGADVSGSNPAAEPVSFEFLDEGVGDGRVVGRVADEDLAVRVTLVVRVLGHSADSQRERRRSNRRRIKQRGAKRDCPDRSPHR